MGSPECFGDNSNEEFVAEFAEGKEPIVFDPEVDVNLQNPVLVEMMRRGPQIGEVVWTGCTGAYVEDFMPDGFLVLRGRPGSAPVDPRNYVPAFGWEDYCWVPK